MCWRMAMWSSAEVHDEVALGNLHTLALREIWHSDRYKRFRREYVTGMNAACRGCVWKTAYKPDPWKSRIKTSEGMSPQLTRGWYVERGRRCDLEQEEKCRRVAGGFAGAAAPD